MGAVLLLGGFLSTNKKPLMQALGAGMVGAMGPQVAAMLNIPGLSGDQNILGPANSQNQISDFERSMALGSPQRGTPIRNIAGDMASIMGNKSGGYGASKY